MSGSVPNLADFRRLDRINWLCFGELATVMTLFQHWNWISFGFGVGAGIVSVPIFMAAAFVIGFIQDQAEGRNPFQ